MTIKRALISVSDKEGLVDFATTLSKLNISLISTGGTAAALRKAKIALTDVSSLTGFSEMLDGRVKTLHPIVHAGILAKRKDKNHVAILKKHHIETIDMVVCNLYPFEQTIKKPKVSIDEVIENIDIGGPTLIRAAAKNYQDVIILTNPAQYHEVSQKLQATGNLTTGEREKLAVEAYAHTAQYDTIVSTYLQRKWIGDDLSNKFSVTMRKIQNMRYGENPHQQGAFYQALPAITEPCITNAVQLQGKELSFNNILDSDCAIECIKEFIEPSCVIIKHATPCGIASASTLLEAWKDAFATDVQSPFGGIVSFNKQVDKNVATELSKYFLEVIIAPGFNKEAIAIFGKKKNLRLLVVDRLDKPINRRGIVLRSVVGGFLVQNRDVWLNDQKNWKMVTTKKPTKNELSTMAFAVKCVKHVKSNSVLFAKETRTIAIGGGQTSRVDAAWIATHKGKENIKGSIMASDAFFPFRDAIDVAAKAGVRAIIQPGGSIRDDEVINAANEHGIAMIFSGQRYFRH